MKPKSKKYKARQLTEHTMFEIRDFIKDYRHPCDNYELILNNGTSLSERPEIRKDLVVKEGDWVVLFPCILLSLAIQGIEFILMVVKKILDGYSKIMAYLAGYRVLSAKKVILKDVHQIVTEEDYQSLLNVSKKVKEGINETQK